MNYPKIYSLSTVGIIKHYNQDYLFHQKRTDFIGSNGVGKSILADLMQMMFVYDKELIKFGTVDVKGERHIHTLPYKGKHAYCFLNIEIGQAQFITIGIQINNSTGKRIIPFVITKETDLLKDKQQLSLDHTQVLFSKDFIINGTIPDLQGLASTLNDSRALKLVPFKSKDEINRYYRFLFEQGILPINLSLEKNLKAFAKVIQSFSKAQSLKLSGDSASKNLKEFLFEDSNDDLLATFESEKFELEKVLKEYNRLNIGIMLLGQKQSRLKSLYQQSEKYLDKWRCFKIDEISNCYLRLEEEKDHENRLRLMRGQQEEQLTTCQNIIQRLPFLKKKMEEAYERAEANFDLARKYRELTETIEKLKDEITELRMVVLPKVDESWKQTSKKDISSKTILEIKNEIAFAIPYISKYKTLAKIEETRNSQQQEIDRLVSVLNAEKLKKEKLLQLLQKKSEGSLLDWYLKKLPELRQEQIEVILHFATMPTSRLAQPQKEDRFIETKEIGSLEISQTETGVWVKSGAISEFVLKNPDTELLSDQKNLKDKVEELKQKIHQELQEISVKLSVLGLIREGKNYNHQLFDIIFDPAISQRATIDQLEAAVSCIVFRDEKITQLQSKKALAETELQALQTQFGLKYNEPEVIERDLKKVKACCFTRITKVSEYLGKKEGENKSLERESNQLLKQLEIASANVIHLQAEFQRFQSAFYTNFNENFIDFNNQIKDLEKSKRESEEALNTYLQHYIELANAFDETRDRRSGEVNYELEQKTYSFGVLERALLGNKIKTTDDIAAALQESNNTRTHIADSIRDNMLKIFGKISDNYKTYKTQIQGINTFFINRKISDKFYFNVKFEENKEINIEYINNLAYSVRQSATRGELQFDQPITEFLEEFFRKMAKLKDKVPLVKLLDPRTYFELAAKLEDEFGAEVPGSTGESYSAIALLGIARLSSQKARQEGLRFIILEELGSIDNTNFKIFPAIAEEFQYQIITMAPHVFNIGLSDEWYAHHLIKGKTDGNINYYASASYFKTKGKNERLDTYLNKINNELDRVESPE